MAAITWVPEEKIVGASRTWANADSGIVQWGLAVDTTKESLPAAQAISALWQICGYCERPRCMMVPPEILAYSGGFGNELVTPEMDAHRIGLDKYLLLKYGFQVASSQRGRGETLRDGRALQDARSLAADDELPHLHLARPRPLHEGVARASAASWWL